MKKFLLTVLLCGLTTVLFLGGCSNIPQKTGTKNLTADYLSKNFVDVLSRSVDFEKIFGDEIKPLNFIAENNGQLSLVAEYSDYTYNGYSNIFSKIKSDRKNKRISIDLELKGIIPNETADLSVYADTSCVVIQSDLLLGRGKSYSIDFSDPEKMLDKFIVSPLGQLLELDEEKVVMFCQQHGFDREYFKSVSGCFEKYMDIKSEIKDLILTEIKEIFDTTGKEVSEYTVDTGGESRKILKYTRTIDSRVVYDIFYVLLSGYEAQTEAGNEFLKILIPSEICDNLDIDFDILKENNLNYFKSGIESVLQLLTDVSLIYNFHFDTKSGMLQKVDGELFCYSDGTQNKVDFTIEPDRNISFEITNGINTVKGVFSNNRTDVSDEYILTLVLPEHPGFFTECAFKIDSEKHVYEFYIQNTEDGIPEKIVSADGNILYSANSLEISFDSVAFYSGEIHPGISLGFSNFAVPQFPFLTEDIFQVSQSQLKGIFERAVSVFINYANFKKGYSGNDSGYFYNDYDFGLR
ncbi:MAG: hypothetical protein IJO74_07070 [Clostridia bacterium]|nr:hypothetical protein [Clostridia bacterium]